MDKKPSGGNEQKSVTTEEDCRENEQEKPTEEEMIRELQNIFCKDRYRVWLRRSTGNRRRRKK
jgi:hypothetical protein